MCMIGLCQRLNVTDMHDWPVFVQIYPVCSGGVQR